MRGGSFQSFEQLQRTVQKKRLREVDEEVLQPGTTLRVRAEIEAVGDDRVLHECRSIVLSWFADELEISFPRKGWRHRAFARASDDANVRAAHLSEADRDIWVLQVERTPGPQKRIVTEVAVGREGAAAPFVAISVDDRSAAPVELADHYPGGVLATLSEATEMRLGTRPLTAHPIVVDSVSLMHVFLRMLVDPQRDRRTFPLVVASVATDGEPPPGELRRWRALARMHTGVAETWVLPQSRTYDLSDTVGKSHSVFLGAWRFYKAGFSGASERSEHPLVLAKRMIRDEEADAVARRFLQLAVRERLRMPIDISGWPEYDAVASREARAVRGPARFVSILRNAFSWGGSSRQREGYRPVAQGPSGPAKDAAPVAVSEPAVAIATEPETAWKPRGEGEARLRTQLREAERKLRELERRAQSGRNQYEDARQRAERAERERLQAEEERDRFQRRVARLEGMVRSMGKDEIADARIPFPIRWSEFVVWCDENLEGKVELTGSARREIDAAAYENVGLVAMCLLWLAGEYRNGRISGNNPNLMGRIDSIGEGVFNRPCGGDSFDCVWNGRSWRADWHIKSGANTRDPRRCLRIYYFWDPESQRVVIASMPAHRRTAFT